MAKHIAALEGITKEKLELVELAALLHDVTDWKYAGKRDSKQADVVKVTVSLLSAEQLIIHFKSLSQEFLMSQNLENTVIHDVLDIIAVVGFKEELQSQESATTPSSMTIEAMIVQDADRCL
jgi:HD superfamily phosphodiesterase